jgi:transcriptional regulator with XRE-family HTH domain
MMEMHEILRQRRIDMGLSQRELAVKLGTSSQSMISEWESGIADPVYRNMVRWADALGVVLVPTNKEWM